MKQAKRIAALLLTMVMVLALCASAFAAGETTGSITIKGVLPGNTFKVYKIFDLSYAPGATAGTAESYSYTISKKIGEKNNPLFDIVSSLTINKGTETEPVNVNVFTLTNKAGDEDVKYVSLSTAIGQVPDTDDTTPKKIADALMAKIIEHNGKPENSANQIELTQQIVKVGTAEEELATGASKEEVQPTDSKDVLKYNITFNNLELGYYLVESSAGTMLGLTTTAPNGVINAKNKLPAIEKKVMTHAYGNPADANSKAFGETVTFRTAVTAEPGAKNYKMYDKMGAGLDYQYITKIYYANSDSGKAELVYERNATSVVVNNTSGKLTIKESTDTVPITYKDETVDFEIDFEDAFMETVAGFKGVSEKTNQIFIEYEAVVTRAAEIGNHHTGKTNKNETWLTYGDNNVEVSRDETTTYVYELDIIKIDDSNKVLTGAQFNLYEHDKTTPVPLVFEIEEAGIKYYHVATVEERNATGFTSAVIDAGHARIKGLGAGYFNDDSGRKYYLDEIKAPDGYNKLAAMQMFEIKGGDNEKLTVTMEAGLYKEGGVKVVNSKGSMLPETGGIGTTIFYVVGGILAVGAVVLLVTKRRMNAA